MTTHPRSRAFVPALVTLGLLIAGPRAAANAFPLQVVAVEYRDLDGDRDRFPDPGETGRVVLTLENRSGDLTNLTLYLTTGDPDVACITEPLLTLASIPAGATVTVGSLHPGEPGFTFKARDTLQTVNPADPARVDLCLRVKVEEIQGLLDPLCFGLAADLDLPEAGAPLIDGPDGLPGTADDGLLLETFDLDRDGDGLFTVLDTFRLRDDGTGATSSGSYLRAGDPAMGTGVLGGVACGGFLTPADGNSGCALDPDFPMDWHLHCPPGSTLCPNLETGPCVGGCSYRTPADGQKALSPPNSLHMGAHFRLDDSRLGDTTHLRALQAFVSPPLNLTLFPRPGDLQLSMFHIARLMDNNGAGPSFGQCFDCGDVQVQRDVDPDPAVDSWGHWEKLLPFQNVYDHVAGAWSVFHPRYCLLTPTDTGTAPPAPRGVHETMCHPAGAWSSCGSVRGTLPRNTFQCPGPGYVDPSGVGVWVETKFDLSPFIGQRVRIRWIGSSWVLEERDSSYYETGLGWDRTLADDGWWVDNLAISGLASRQEAALVDVRPAAPVACPAARPCARVLSDLVAWWPLDRDATDIVGGLDGTLLGDATFTRGLVGGALTLDGVGDRMTTPLVVDYTRGITFEAWIRTGGSGGLALGDAGGPPPNAGARLTLSRGRSRIRFHGLVDDFDGTNFILAGGLVADDLFHHVAAVWTGDTTTGGARLYVDGVLVATGTARFPVSTGSSPLVLGTGFEGQIDEAAVFARTLTGEEVGAIHAAGSSGKCRDPLRGRRRMVRPRAAGDP